MAAQSLKVTNNVFRLMTSRGEFVLYVQKGRFVLGLLKIG